MRTEVTRAYRVALDPTAAQAAALASHAGASRAAYNFAIAAKITAHRQYRQVVAELTYTRHADLTPDDALVAAKKTAAAERSVRFPTYMDSIKAMTGDPECQWHHQVNRYSLTSAMRNADRAWSNWVSSVTGQRTGRAVGYPRFHKKGRSRDSFTLFHDVKKPSLRPDGYRRLVLPEKISGRRGGSVRVKGNIRQLARRIAAGKAVIASVTISRGGRHWWVSILAREVIEIPDRPTRSARARGAVGVDVGVKHLATLSTGEHLPNPQHLRTATQRLRKAQRALSRTKWIRDSDGALVDKPTRGTRCRPTAGRIAAQRRVAKAHADVAERRASTTHALTKRLATQYALIGIEDLNVAGMTRSARGTIEEPGRNVAAKTGLNRAVLDAAFGEIRRQLTYKTGWYGTHLAVIDRYAPTSKTCSKCGAVKTTLRLTEREYHCTSCETTIDRDHNAALNIAALAEAMHHDARGKQESRNADRAPARDTPRAGAKTSEGQERPAPPATPRGEPRGRPPQTDTPAA